MKQWALRFTQAGLNDLWVILLMPEILRARPLIFIEGPSNFQNPNPAVPLTAIGILQWQVYDELQVESLYP